jgi:hypothetical protein
MANLKAGTVEDFADSMAAYIEQAMRKEWQTMKRKALPTSLGEEDRRILFAAIAQGVLKFLYDHRSSIATTAVKGDICHRHTLEFEVSGYRTPLP